MTYKIAVIGDYDSILPFKMIGFDIYPIRQSSQVRPLLEELVAKQYGVVYLTEQLAQDIPETIAHYRALTVPTVILIPNHHGSLGIGLASIQENVEKAIGQNIL